jgi:hypothetical protein
VFAALLADALLLVYALVTLVEERSLVSDSLTFEDRRRLFDLDDRVETINGLFLALIVVTAVTLMVWMFRAAKNNEALGRRQPRFGPGWSIGGWLIPLANFVIPVLIMQDLWRGSDPAVPRDDIRWKIGNRSLLVGLWWGLLLFGRVLVAVGAGQIEESATLDGVRGGITVQIFGNVFTIAATVLAFFVVKAITQRQEECLRVQQGGAVPPPPPG